MRTLSKSVLVIGIFLFAVTSLFSQKALFENIKITPRWSIRPEFAVNNVITRGTNTQSRWLQIDVDYTSVAMKQAWLDDVIIKYDILLPQTSIKKVVLSGQIQYWSLAMDGEINHAMAFVHPRFLQRYAPGLRMKKGDLKDLRILVTFIQNDSTIAMGFYKFKSKTTLKSVRTEIGAALQNRTTFKVKDSVFGRDETPWGVINVDYYELIKRKK